MKGQILDFSVQSNSGVITGEDGQRYTFSGAEWKGTATPSRGATVDFQPAGENATGVYPAVSGGSSGEKNKVVAGLLALFFGSLGVHKFYLGYQKEGVIMLLVGLVAGVFTCGASTVVIGVIALIEGIIYLMKPDGDFEATYVSNSRPWF